MKKVQQTFQTLRQAKVYRLLKKRKELNVRSCHINVMGMNLTLGSRVVEMPHKGPDTDSISIGQWSVRNRCHIRLRRPRSPYPPRHKLRIRRSVVHKKSMLQYLIALATESLSLYRHGDRTPLDPYPNDPFRNTSLWPVGWGQLTPVNNKSLGVTPLTLNLFLDRECSSPHSRRALPSHLPYKDQDGLRVSYTVDFLEWEWMNWEKNHQVEVLQLLPLKALDELSVFFSVEQLVQINRRGNECTGIAYVSRLTQATAQLPTTPRHWSGSADYEKRAASVHARDGPFLLLVSAPGSRASMTSEALARVSLQSNLFKLREWTS
uniref:Uncharacterized protein n=1 Tax=Timema poppense TaxID=170557 RepID=A0A7R9CRR5_TIMPO|nr:unnamed protein product [Timema poppensis]